MSEMGNQVKLIKTFHPHTYDHFERTIMVFADMIQSCVIDFIGWFDVFEVRPMGTNLLRYYIYSVCVIQEPLCTAQSGQKSFNDRRLRPLEFMVRDRVFLQVTLGETL
ncbi:hypothetical protein MTR67_022948 [Solanum verrucosum]|uniref:Uncharacterized protein n=1 Tax=Solanum verrucosum TaxID=315347 RepID=A0AAF0QUE3_SOLVR|nr:hypothetical protein MTR67_022948 [Solanum verrucosum]